MNESLDCENFAAIFGNFLDQQPKNPLKKAAKSFGCSIAVLDRLLRQETLPTSCMLKQAACMMLLGLERYSKLSDAERRKISDLIGPLCGGTIGFAGISTAVSSLGIVSGLSAAGITSGLAGLGGLAGGGMLAGVTVAAALPIAMGAAGFGVFRGVKHLRQTQRLENTDIDPRWEFF